MLSSLLLTVDGHSMNPTLGYKERVIINKLAYDIKFLSRKDIIVFRPSFNQDIIYIKRIIGLPGDKVKIQDNYIYINGKR